MIGVSGNNGRGYHVRCWPDCGTKLHKEYIQICVQIGRYSASGRGSAVADCVFKLFFCALDSRDPIRQASVPWHLEVIETNKVNLERAYKFFARQQADEDYEF